MTDTPTTADLLKRLRTDIKKAGGRKAWMERNGFSRSYLSDVLNEYKPFPESIAERWGYVPAELWKKK